MTEKIDLKKELRFLYRPSAGKPEIIQVPEMNFLMIDGAGNPNTSLDYQQAVEALYSVSYVLKFKCKQALGQDYVVMPLEGLWWGVPINLQGYSEAEKDRFQWTMMIMQPEFVTADMFDEALSEVGKKKNLPGLAKMRFETFDEGWAVQILHVGPYDAEGQNIEKMHRFADTQGWHLRGKHHEIYLSDPRRTATEKLKTILRHPVVKA